MILTCFRCDQDYVLLDLDEKQPVKFCVTCETELMFGDGIRVQRVRVPRKRQTSEQVGPVLFDDRKSFGPDLIRTFWEDLDPRENDASLPRYPGCDESASTLTGSQINA